MKKIITIAGTGGSGKSTICNLISNKLGYKCYLMGDIMRSLAKEHNMDIVTFNAFMKTTEEFDHKVDNMIVDICNSEEELVISSRTAWHFVPDSFKVYIYVEPDIAAKRIFEDSVRTGEKKYSTIEEAKNNTIERYNLELERYKKIYNIDVSKFENYDLVIDSSNLTIEEVLNKVFEEYNKYLKGEKN